MDEQNVKHVVALHNTQPLYLNLNLQQQKGIQPISRVNLKNK